MFPAGTHAHTRHTQAETAEHAESVRRLYAQIELYACI